jgi:two-component system sensor histidine kinase HydH
MQEYQHDEDSIIPLQILQPIFENRADTIIIGLKRAQYEPGFRYAVAIAAEDRSAIVANLDAENILRIRREVGFGVLLRQLVENPGIVYVALQDTQTILAASGNVQFLEPITSSQFLFESFRDSLFLTRTTLFDSVEVFEAVHPFIMQQKIVGLFRLGLSLKPIEDINARIFRRLIIITIVLILIGSLIFTFLFVRQRLDLVQKQYQEVETYSSNIIRDVSDAIIVYNKNDGVKIFNAAAENLFKKHNQDIIGRSIQNILPASLCTTIINSSAAMQQVECPIDNSDRTLLVSKTGFSEENENTTVVLVIRDLTEQKLLESQIQRQERLSAMGALASGVAHEIRNPLNTIGTIIQQLDKDFDPKEDSDEYHELAQIIYQEVKRINKTIEEFLKFTRPESLKPEQFKLKEFFNLLSKQYQSLMQKHNIFFKINLEKDYTVYWDRGQMQQVFMNLLQNAIDAIAENGEISIQVREENHETIEIIIVDTGIGMNQETRDKIFNIYYSTKANGTGIGLSIVQKIIFEHNGSIHVESRPEKGTRFHIRIPVKIPEKANNKNI